MQNGDIPLIASRFRAEPYFRSLPALFAFIGLASVARAAEEAPVHPAVQARVGPADMELRTDAQTIGRLEFGAFSGGWQKSTATAASDVADQPGSQRRALRIKAANGVSLAVDVRVESLPVSHPAVLVRARFTADADGEFDAVHASLALAYPLVAGRAVEVFENDGGGAARRIEAPNERVKPQLLATDRGRRIAFELRDAGRLRVGRLDAGPVLLQDDRHWALDTLTLRLQPAGAAKWKKGESREVAFTLDLPGGLHLSTEKPVTLSAGGQWIALNEPGLDIRAGSALDFSGWTARHEPAGKFGRVLIEEGKFVFQDDPGARRTPRRFYGVNFCFSSQYLEGDEPQRLAARLARMGYNAVRIHHYESGLVNKDGCPPGDSTVPGAREMDQLDRFFAAMKERGLYLTTDLYVSRPVWTREVWPEAKEGERLADNLFKLAVLVNDRAFENWCAFAKNLLVHVNPHTGLAWGQDPALAWISLVNEGNPGNFIHQVGQDPRLAADYQRAYRAWCDRQPWDTPPPAALPTNWRAANADGAVARRFMADLEREGFARMKAFVRGLGCVAHLSNANGWSHDALSPLMRADYDYVDDHFYVDHPEFPEKPWTLPSKCPNESTVARGVIGGTATTALRLAGKPLVISEFNYSAPGRFRGVGGLLTGALAARQDWDILWRFAYSHTRNNLFTPGSLGYFDIAADPLNQIAERAALCLFLRGDLARAEPEIRVLGDDDAFLRVNETTDKPGAQLEGLALGARFVTERSADPAAAGRARDGGAVVLSPEEARRPEAWTRLAQALRERGRDAPRAPGEAVRIGRIGEDDQGFALDSAADTLVFSTPRTAGGYAGPGVEVDAHYAKFVFGGSGATGWVSSVDGGTPIVNAARLIVCHLTDVQNSGARYAEEASRTWITWGGLPWLALNGSATLTVRRAPGAPVLRAWALSLAGERREEIPVRYAGDGGASLTLELSVKGEKGARLAYELAVK